MREGEVVAGKYRIGRLLGSGAMGTVFAAHHILLDQKVAIKFLVPESLGHSDSVARFVREARATATIKSEYVVRVLDVALRDGGGPYIVMEYLEGSDLAAWLRANGPPDVNIAVDFVLQACEAIAEAHDLGIIHRDVKPANLFVVQRRGVVDTIKVLDFGISKAAGLVSSTAPPGEWRPGAIITEERVPIGSPCYMSPEQMESARDVDCRTDIWALGVTLCELVTGHLPFEGQSLVQVYATIRSGARLRVGENVPRGLEAVIRKCLEPERDHRYASVGELQAALSPFGSLEGTTPIQRRQNSPRSSETGAVESASGAVPSPRGVFVRKADDTLVSAEARVKSRARGVWMRTMSAVGFAALIAVLGLIALVTKSTTRGTYGASLGSIPPTSTSARPSASTAGPEEEPSAARAASDVPVSASSHLNNSNEKRPVGAPLEASASSGMRRMPNPPSGGPPALTGDFHARSGTEATAVIRDSGGLEKKGDSESPSAMPAARSQHDAPSEWVPPDVQR